MTITLLNTWSPETPSTGAFSVEESYPSGWTVTGTTGGGSTSIQGKVKWFTTDPSLAQVQYTLAVPAEAEGTFIFHGEYRDHNMATGTPNRIVGGPTSVTVTCGESGDGGGDNDEGSGEGPSDVTRRDPGAQTCATSFTVFIDVHWGAQEMIVIDEEVPAGWSASEPTGGGNTETAGHVKWVLMNPDVTTVQYTLTSPTEAAGTFLLTGEWRDDSMGSEAPSNAIGGADSVTVTCPEAGTPVGAEVQRDEMINPGCGTNLEVYLFVVWNDTEEVFIEETYPSGWDVIATTAGGNTDSPGQVKWFLNDPSVSVVSYTLALPEETFGTFGFTGAFRDSTMSGEDPDRSVTGDDEVTVTCEMPPHDGAVIRSLPAACRGDLTVTLTVTPATGTSAWFIDETIPVGLSVGAISGGGTYNTDTGQIKWVSTQGDAAVLTYVLTIPEEAPEGTSYGWFGEYRFHDVMADRDPITGADSLTTECVQLHPYDANGDCRIDDTELFQLIDGWKMSAASDDELFAGIDAWKLYPGTYCEE